MPHKYFQVEGVATFLHHTGATTLPGAPPHTSRGRVVLCLHGAGGNSGHFGALLDLLAERHSPLGFDFPGHGRSGGLDSLASIEQMAAFTGALIDKLALPAPLLLGHSMGAAVALELALTRPDSISGLVLVGGGARVTSLEPVIAQLERVTAGKERRPFAREIYAAGASNEVMQRGFTEELKTDPRARLGAFRALQAFDATDRVGAIRVPTLVVVGDEELPALAEQAELLSAAIPGARKTVVEGAGHMLSVEKPEALAAAVEALIEGMP